jgi:hypothetical protein
MGDKDHSAYTKERAAKAIARCKKSLIYCEKEIITNKKFAQDPKNKKTAKGAMAAIAGYKRAIEYYKQAITAYEKSNGDLDKFLVGDKLDDAGGSQMFTGDNLSNLAMNTPHWNDYGYGYADAENPVFVDHMRIDARQDAALDWSSLYDAERMLGLKGAYCERFEREAKNSHAAKLFLEAGEVFKKAAKLMNSAYLLAKKDANARDQKHLKYIRYYVEKSETEEKRAEKLQKQAEMVEEQGATRKDADNTKSHIYLVDKKSKKILKQFTNMYMAEDVVARAREQGRDLQIVRAPSEKHLKEHGFVDDDRKSDAMSEKTANRSREEMREKKQKEYDAVSEKLTEARKRMTGMLRNEKSDDSRGDAMDQRTKAHYRKMVDKTKNAIEQWKKKAANATSAREQSEFKKEVNRLEEHLTKLNTTISSGKEHDFGGEYGIQAAHGDDDDCTYQDAILFSL